MSEARTFLPETDTLDNEDVTSAYSRWAPIYDLTFERVMRPGRRAIAAATARLDGTLLDVGHHVKRHAPSPSPTQLRPLRTHWIAARDTPKRRAIDTCVSPLAQQ